MKNTKKLNKLNILFFAIALSAFNLTIAMEKSTDTSVGHESDRSDKERALFTAIEYGHTNIVKLLIDNSANLNERNLLNGTALRFAALHGYVEVVDLLIEAGYDVNATNKSGDTALMLAVKEGHIEVVKRLIKAGARC